MTNLTIDILLAVYNNAEYLAAQLHSLMEQTYPHFRIIARDDCSTDHSIEIIEEFNQRYPEKIVLIKGNENLGARGNFATLIHHAQADYIMFCDADDVWFPTKIEESLILMQKNEALYGRNSPILIHTDLTVTDKHLCVLNHSFWNYSKLNPQLANHLNRLLTHNVITGCTLLINKPLLSIVAPIPKEAIMHDWWIGIVASTFGHIDFLDKSTLFYRQHGKNDTGAKNWRSLGTYWSHMKKGMERAGRCEMRQQISKTIQQALCFSLRYSGKMEIQKQKIVQHYTTLGTSGILKKRILFFKHRYFKNTFIKNSAMFLFL